MDLESKFDIELHAYKAVVGLLEDLQALGLYRASANDLACAIGKTVFQTTRDLEQNKNGKFPGMEKRIFEAVQHECFTYRYNYNGIWRRLVDRMVELILCRFSLKLGEGKHWSNT